MLQGTYRMPGIMDVFHWAFDTNKTSFSLKPPRFPPDLATKCGCHWQTVRETTSSVHVKTTYGLICKKVECTAPQGKVNTDSWLKEQCSVPDKSPFIMPNELYHIDMLINHMKWNEIYLIFGSIRWIIKKVPTYIYKDTYIYNVQYIYFFPWKQFSVWFSIKDTLKLFSKIRNNFGRIWYGLPFLALSFLVAISV